VMISAPAEQQLLTSRVPDLKTDFLLKRLALWSNLNLLDQIPKVNGSSTLQMREQKELESIIYGASPRDLPVLADFLNASYGTVPGQVFQWTNRPSTLPIVTAGQKPVFGTAREILDAVTATNFAPAQEVYLPVEAKGVVSVTNGSDVKVGSSRWMAHRIEAEVEAIEPSLVVIAQSFYHPWKASIDGAQAKIWRANGAYQAVQVPGGRHRLVLEYVDRAFQVGLGISLAGMLACVGLWGWSKNSQTI